MPGLRAEGTVLCVDSWVSNPPGIAWIFGTGYGYQGISYVGISDIYYTLAVRLVSVVPEPASMVLFGAGGVVVAVRRMLLRLRG